jgi:PAS domain S-box-containing protein
MRFSTSAGLPADGPSPRRHAVWFPTATAAAVATVGLAALAGWTLGVPVFRSGVPGLVEMKVNTAVCFVLASVALWLLGGPRPRARRAGLVLCVAVALVALATLAEYIFGRSLGIDELLFRDTGAVGTSAPGRMTPDKAVAFMLVAGALATLDARRLGAWLSSGLAVGALLVAFVPVLGDVNDIASGSKVSDLIAMLVPAAAAFIALGAAILSARPADGVMRLVLADTLGGRVMRLLVPATLAVPVLLGALRLGGQHWELFESDTGAWLFALAVMYGLAASLDRAERASRRALAAHREVQRERTAFEQAPIGGALTSPDGHYTRVNRAFCAMVGYPAEELVGKQFSAFTHPESGPDDAQSLAALLDGSLRVHHGEKRYMHRDGSLVHARVAVTPIYDDAGEVSQLYAQMQDMTESDLAADRLKHAQFETLSVLAAAAEYRDDETGEHTRRVGATGARLADRLGLPEAVVHLIRLAAPLHDIGKIGIPDAILLKPGRLTNDEFDDMKRHTTIGAQMLAGGASEQLAMAAQIAASHHERWDGTGYPCGVAGDAIPIAGRIVAVADVFDALTHARPYKDAWPREQALEELTRQRGLQFDPDVIDAFFELVETPAVRDAAVGASPALTSSGRSPGDAA